jgi:hypothetical protein
MNSNSNSRRNKQSRNNGRNNINNQSGEYYELSIVIVAFTEPSFYVIEELFWIDYHLTLLNTSLSKL